MAKERLEGGSLANNFRNVPPESRPTFSKPDISGGQLKDNDKLVIVKFCGVHFANYSLM